MNPPLTARERMLGGSWYIPPTDQDWLNLDAARVRRMLVGFTLLATRPTVLDALNTRHISVIARLSDQDFLTLPPAVIISALESARLRASVDGLIMFNEPDAGYDMGYASKTTWANEPEPVYPGPGGKLLHYKGRLTYFMAAYERAYPTIRNSRNEKVGRAGPSLIVGAFGCKTTHPTDPPYPGLMAWNRVLYDSLSGADKWCVHCYTENYHGPGDLERLQYGAQFGCSIGNPTYIIDELGVLHKDPESRQVDGYLAFLRWQLSPVGLAPGNVGALVDLNVPFTFNGDPRGGQAWPPSYLLQDPASYARLGDFIRNG